MRTIQIANTLSKIWSFLIILLLVLAVLAGQANNKGEDDMGAFGIISGIVIPSILFYYLVQLLFKPLKRNRKLYMDFLDGNNVEKYSKNRIWVMICTVVITVLFILPTLGLILSLTILQFMSLSKQKSIIV